MRSPATYHNVEFHGRSNLFAVIMSVMLLMSCGEKDSTPQQSEGTKNTLQTSPKIDEVGEFRLLSYEQRQGRQLYLKYCSVCHGEQGKGDGFNAFNLNPKPRDFTDAAYMNALSDVRVAETISQGGRGVNRSPLMPSWGGRMSKKEIAYVVDYILSISAQAE